MFRDDSLMWTEEESTLGSRLASSHLLLSMEDHETTG